MLEIAAVECAGSITLRGMISHRWKLLIREGGKKPSEARLFDGRGTAEGQARSGCQGGDRRGEHGWLRRTSRPNCFAI